MSDSFTIPGVFAVKVGDNFTIENIHALQPNRGRRWWQVWKPKLVASRKLQEFRVVA